MSCLLDLSRFTGYHDSSSTGWAPRIITDIIRVHISYAPGKTPFQTCGDKALGPRCEDPGSDPVGPPWAMAPRDYIRASMQDMLEIASSLMRIVRISSFFSSGYCKEHLVPGGDLACVEGGNGGGSSRIT